MHVTASKLNLKGRDAVGSACGGAYFCRKIRQGSDVMPRRAHRIREVLSLDLDTISRVAGESHDMEVT